MSTTKTTIESLMAGVKLATGEHHVVVIERILAYFVELDQVCFGFNSAVLLPAIVRDAKDVDAPASALAPGSTTSRPVVPPLIAVKAMFDFAEAHSDLKVLVVGHTDTVGSESANNKLSADRATNAHMFLSGDRSGWAAACKRSTLRDQQVIFDWAARVFGFACHPGPIDNKEGPRTTAARERFRQRYNDEFGGNLKRKASWGETDWKAVYDLYEARLARYCDVDVKDLSAKRSLLHFESPATLACGKSWPIAAAGIENLRSRGNRRVDVVFMEDKPHPDLQSSKPPGRELYGRSIRFKRVVPEIIPDIIELRLLGPEGYPIPEVQYELTLVDGSKRRGQLDKTGNAIERAVPDGDFKISYKPSDAIRARALAGRLRYALESPRDIPSVYMILSQSSETLQDVAKSYAEYFDTLVGKGMRADVIAAVKGTPDQAPIDHLLAVAQLSELAPESTAQPIAWAVPQTGDPANANPGGSIVV